MGEAPETRTRRSHRHPLQSVGAHNPERRLDDEFTAERLHDYLLDTSLGENTHLGRPDANEEQLASVIDAVGLTEFVDSLPEGLDSPVGPGGSRISGGQRQRGCVARALLKAAPLTLMDEATSALDTENARLVSTAAQTLAETAAWS